MGSIYFAAPLAVPADVAWCHLDRFTWAEVLPFSSTPAGCRGCEYTGGQL